MLRILAFAAAILMVTLPAVAEEVIERLVSDITINADSSIDVTEIIAVTAEGDQIKRGIFRDFPTRYTDSRGNDYVVGFEVTGVKRDGESETYALEDIGNGVRIRIGNRDVLLEHGPHTYTITYRATRELGFFDGYDELYWNVTGSDWKFPILGAEAVIHLPAGATVKQSAAYTGQPGEKGQDFRVVSDQGSTYRASLTRRLEPGEGLTVAVGFTKGIVTPPPPPVDTTAQSLVALAGAVLAMLLYYLFAWFRVGRDPKGGAIIPLYDAPPGLGAAGVRYVWKHGFDQKTFAAGVIGLAAKGCFAIKVKDKGSYSVEKVKDSGPAVTGAEARMLKAHPGGTLDITDKHHTTIAAMRQGLESELAKDYGASTYRSNSGWFWAGVPLSAAVLVPAFAFMNSNDLAGALVVGVFFALLWAFLVWLLYMDVKAFFKRGFWRKIASGIGFLVLAFLVLMLSLVAVNLVSGPENRTMGLYSIGFAALAFMHVLFVNWLTAPTVLGRKLMDQIEGLRLYMATAEEKRLDMLNPPQKTPELFERLLPYALALDCENQWSEKFSAVLAAAAYAGPAWYSGSTGFNINNFGDFSSTLNTSQYDHTVHTSSSGFSPGSFSGSSGGGSSGGGGGGGGGGGW